MTAAYVDGTPEGDALLQTLARSQLMSAHEELRITHELKQLRELITFYTNATTDERDEQITHLFHQLTENYQRQIDAYSNALFDANIRWVLKLVNKSSRLEFMDRFQWAAIGLWRAIRLYDPDVLVHGKSVRLSTYATYWIRQSMQRGADQDERLIRIPVGGSDLLKRIQKAKAAYQQVHGQTPTLPELCAAYPDIDLEAAQRLELITSPTLSLSYPEQESSASVQETCLEHIVTSDNDDIEEHFVEQAHIELLRGNVRDAIDALAMHHEQDQKTGEDVYPFIRHAQVLRLRYRIGDPDPTLPNRSLEEVGALLDPPVTRARVGQLHTVAVRWIRDHCVFLRAFIDSTEDF